MLKSKKLKAFLWVGGLLLFVLSLYLFNKDFEITYNKQGGTAYTRFEKAEILKVANESLEKDKEISGLLLGTQDLEVRILTGEHKGEIHKIKNHLSNYYNVYGKAGQTLIVAVDTASKDYYTVNVFNYYRAPILYGLVLLFFGVLWLIGGKKGLKSVTGLVFTLLTIIFLFIPMIYRGYPPILASLLIIIVTTCVTLFLLNGWSSKTLSAIFGTILGLMIAAAFSSLAGSMTHITGFNTEGVDTLVVIARESGMQLRGILFAGILIASLGAVMDVAMSIASSIYEVYLANRKLSGKELFLSGMNVGQDMMGTMANTLILAFTGASLNTMLLIYASRVQYNQLINMDMVGIEVIQGLAGSIAVILTVPIVSYISSQLIPLMEQTTHQKTFKSKKHHKKSA